MMNSDVMTLILHYSGYTGEDNTLAHTYSLVCKDWCNALNEFRWATLTTPGIPTAQRYHALVQKLQDDPVRASRVNHSISRERKSLNACGLLFLFIGQTLELDMYSSPP